MLEHAADVRQEPHVEHAIGLVQHEVFDAVEPGVRRLEVIEQPARRGDDHVHAAAEGMLLRTHAHAAVHRGAGQRRMHGQRVEVLEDLRRELARRRQHERARRAARLADQPVQDGQQKGRGLAAAGLRAGEHVAPGHRRRNRLGLNRRRPREAELTDSLEQIGMEAKRGKGHLGILLSFTSF